MALVLAAPAAAQRFRYSMDPGWRFTLGDPAGAESPGFDDRAWRRLDLPHDWSIEGTPREDAPGGGRVGKRSYGYISFAYDVTRELVSGVNVPAVRVDNSSQPNSRWYSTDDSSQSVLRTQRKKC